MLFRMKDKTRVDLLLVITLFLPVFWEQLASIALSVFSTAISSNIDTAYLTATSLVGSVVGPLTTLYGSIATGASILMSQYMGGGDEDKCKKLFATSNLVGISVSLVIALLIILFRTPVLHYFYPNMSETFLVNGSIYAVFLAITIPMAFFRTNIMGILRGCLNTKGPFYISFFGGIIDIALRFLFMVVFKWGIWGLGLASLTANLFFTSICFIILYMEGTFKGCIKNIFKLIDRGVAVKTVKIGGVMCIQSFLTSISALILSQILAKMGDFEITVYTIAFSATSLFTLAPNAMAYVAQILAGKYKGAEDEMYAYKITVALTIASTLVCVAMALIMYPLAEVIVGIYSTDAVTIAYSAKVLRIYLVCSTLFWGTGNVFSAGIRGAGNVKYPAFVLSFASWAYMIPMTWLVCSVLGRGADGRMFVVALEQALYAAFFIGFGIYKFRKLKNNENEN